MIDIEKKEDVKEKGSVAEMLRRLGNVSNSFSLNIRIHEHVD